MPKGPHPRRSLTFWRVVRDATRHGWGQTLRLCLVLLVLAVPIVIR